MHSDTVVNQRHVIPLASLMFEVFGVESSLVFTGFDEGVEEPLIAVQSNLQQDTVVLSVFLNMQPALLGGAAGVGTENRLDRERGCRGNRISLNDQPVINTVEQNGFSS